nr:14726_t:CDS:2 [Entrophospora candida]
MVKTTFYVTLVSFIIQIQSILAAPAAPPAVDITVINNCVTPSTVALTFDDGPYIYTTELLATLKTEGVNATFFMNGNNYGCIYDQANVDIVNAVKAAGHQIGSHTWSHPDLAKISIAQVTKEMTRLDDAFKKVAGFQPKYMRPPFGSGADNAGIKKAIADVGYTKMVLWDLDPSDAIDGTKFDDEVKQYTNAAPPPASHISLNHDIIESTVKKLVSQEIKILKDKGYTSFVTVGQCLGETEDLWYKFVGAPSVRDDTWTCA